MRTDNRMEIVIWTSFSLFLFRSISIFLSFPLSFSISLYRSLALFIPHLLSLSLTHSLYLSHLFYLFLSLFLYHSFSFARFLWKNQSWNYSWWMDSTRYLNKQLIFSFLDDASDDCCCKSFLVAGSAIALHWVHKYGKCNQKVNCGRESTVGCLNENRRAQFETSP